MSIQFSQKLGNTGLLMQEPFTERYDIEMMKNIRFKDILMNVEIAGHKAISGSWNSGTQTIENLVVEWLENDGSYTVISYSNELVPSITVNPASEFAQRHLYLAKKDGSFESIELVDYLGSFSFDPETEFPILHYGHYNNTGSTKQEFFKFIAPKKQSIHNLEIIQPNSGKVEIRSSDIELNQNGRNLLYETVPAGSIIAFGATTPPTGWLNCNGAAINRLSYSDLYDAIGTNYGNGNGSSTFNIPDLRGYFLRGHHSGDPTDPDYVGRNIGDEQLDAFQGHWHRGIARTSGSQNAYTISSSSGFQPQNYTDGSIRQPVNDGINDNPRTAKETRPINKSALYIIKY
jgi:microcystin-dependent protein